MLLSEVRASVRHIGKVAAYLNPGKCLRACRPMEHIQFLSNDHVFSTGAVSIWLYLSAFLQSVKAAATPHQGTIR